MKFPLEGDVVVKRPDFQFDPKLLQERAREIVGRKTIYPKWQKRVRILSADDACESIRAILESKYEPIDGVMCPDGRNVDISVTHQWISNSEKLIRIAVVLGCLADPLAGKMFDADSDGILFEAYNRICLSYLYDRHPDETTAAKK